MNNLSGQRVIKVLSFLLTLIIFTSCVTNTEDYQGHFSIDSLLTKQNEHLRTLKASVKKVGNLNEKNDDVDLPILDSLAWENELTIFRELEAINKPIYKNTYTVEDALPDSKSNLQVKWIAHKKDLPKNEIPPVKYLKIFYQGSRHNVRKIEAQLDETNALYTSSRLLTMEFQHVHDHVVLTSYTIEGGQKMFLGDTVAYVIRGVVKLPN